MSQHALRRTTEGVTVYLDANGKLDACVARVERAGGRRARLSVSRQA